MQRCSMARGKKKEELTLEEKLERALVPVEKQPYEVPENWCWVYQNVVCQLGDGEKRNDKKHTYLEVKYLRGHKEADFKNTGKYIEKGTKIILVDGENSGEVFEVSEDGYMGSTFKVLNISCGINEKYLLYFVDSKRDLLRNSKTGSAIPHLNKKLFFSLGFPLPPLEEQKRIVEQIENLFAKLDEAKEKVQEVIDGYVIREVSLLQKAVSGELTQEWREKNGISKIDWNTISLKDCGTWFGGGTPTTSKKEYWDGGTIPWITSKDMKDRLIDDSLLHVTQAGINNSSARYCDKPAVLFVMRSGILRRILPVCMVKVPFTVNQDLKAVIPEKIQQEYLYWACTAYEKDIRENCMKSGTTVESIEAKKLLEYKLPLPDEKEQKVIVDVIENLIHKEEFAKQVAIQILEKIDIMKKSILAKAFRGELGTNKLEEGSSMELLKEILVKI